MKNNFRVLMIEDNIPDAELIERALERSNGFNLITHRVETEKELTEALDFDHWDLVICDFSLPQLSFRKAMDIIELFDYDIPVIIVTGSISSSDVMQMLGYTTHYGYINKNELWLIGPSIKHIRRIEEEQYQQLEVLVRALEYKDHNTKEHSDRVVGLTVAIAEEMGISNRKVSYIKRGALLHDIGKVGIPDYILLKEGPLTEAERDVMKMHPELGYNLLKTVPSMRRFIDIPRYHHERWDGSGYPEGLSGGKIPLPARIFSIVDVYDAMSNDRIYRAALPKDEVLEYIKSESGKYFDPAVVVAFLNVVTNTTRKDNDG